MGIRLIIADDHKIVRKGIRALLDEKEDLEVVGEAETGRQCLELVARHRPDIVLMDITMPDMDGIQATEEIGASWPGVRVVGLTMHEDAPYVLRLVQAGAAGYVVKGADPEELLSAVYAAARGEVYLQSSVAAHVIAGMRSHTQKPPAAETVLTERETEVLTLIAEGLTAREIAERLVISAHTVERHRANIMNKLGVHNKVELVHYALQEELVRSDG